VLQIVSQSASMHVHAALAPVGVLNGSTYRCAAGVYSAALLWGLCSPARNLGVALTGQEKVREDGQGHLQHWQREFSGGAVTDPAVASWSA
jgi:hypothetical protein